MKSNKITRRERRIKHIRKHVFGTTDRPRVYPFRSNRHIYVYISNDEVGRVISGMSDRFLLDGNKKLTQIEKSYILGKEFGKKILELGFSKVVFDRRGYKYHGRIKSLAEGLRDSGVLF